jgi:hypothetical protein
MVWQDLTTDPPTASPSQDPKVSHLNLRFQVPSQGREGTFLQR